MTKRKHQNEYKRTPAQTLLGIHLKELGMLVFYEIHIPEDSARRFDLAAWNERLLFEISGGNWNGGHRRGAEQEKEYEKINTAQMMGWRVMQFTNRQVLTGQAKAFLEQWLAGDCRHSAATKRA